MVGQADDGRRPQSVGGCEAGCLNCRGGLSKYHILCPDTGSCPLCGGVPDAFPQNDAAAERRLDELRDLVKLYRLQIGLGDGLRELTLRRMRLTLDALEALERGQSVII